MVILNAVDAANYLKQSDSYLNNLNLFNLHLHNTSSLHDYVQLISASTLDFTTSEIGDLNQIIKSLKLKFTKLKVPFPENISFIKTTGMDCFGLPYTRRNAIILPETIFQYKGNDDLCKLSEGLIAHEIFHILSRNNKKLTSIYKLWGFKKSNIDPPYNMVQNPDAPDHNYGIELSDGIATPFIVKNNTIEHCIFINNTFQKISKEYIKKTKTPSIYCCHPEEISAEAFRLLITGKKFKERKSFYSLLQKSLANK
jgi:hypothetical protein